MADESSETNNSSEETVEDGTATSPVDVESPSEDSSATPEETKPSIAPRLSLAFPIVVALLELVLATYFLATATIPMRAAIGGAVVPLVSTLLLLLWWLLSRTIPLRERAAGLALAVVAVAVPLLTIQPLEPFFLIYLLPGVTTSVVIVAAATHGMRWPLRRKGLIAALLICLVGFSCMRVVGVDGNMVPVLGWRWSSADGIATQENKVAAVPKEATKEDWPGFRGAARDNRNLVDEFNIDWDNHPPKELWRRPVGAGWGGFTVVGDYCYTQEQRGEEEAVVCYEAATGEQVWVTSVPALFEERTGDGPRATPEFRDGKLFTQGAMGDLLCLDAATGETLWQKNIAEDSGARVPQWGFSSTPLVANGLVITFTAGDDGKSVLAYKQEDGELAWSTGRKGQGYSSAQMAELALTPQILMSSNFGLEAFDPMTGARLWEQEWKITTGPRVVQPFVMARYPVAGGPRQGKGLRLIKVDKDSTSGAWSTKTIWESKKFRPYFNDFVYYHGYFYGFDGNRLGCVETTDGSVRWRGGRYGGQILLLAKMEMLIVLTEKGEVLLIPAFPGKEDVVGRFQALEGKTWNHPVVAHNRLFLRNDKEAVCYELPPVPVEEEAEAPAAH